MSLRNVPGPALSLISLFVSYREHACLRDLYPEVGLDMRDVATHKYSSLARSSPQDQSEFADVHILEHDVEYPNDIHGFPKDYEVFPHLVKLTFTKPIGVNLLKLSKQCPSLRTLVMRNVFPFNCMSVFEHVTEITMYNIGAFLPHRHCFPVLEKLTIGFDGLLPVLQIGGFPRLKELVVLNVPNLYLYDMPVLELFSLQTNTDKQKIENSYVRISNVPRLDKVVKPHETCLFYR